MLTHPHTNITHTFNELSDTSVLQQNPHIHLHSPSPTSNSSLSISFHLDNSDIHLFSHKQTSRMSSKNTTSASSLATVEHNIVNQPPVVSAGELVPCSIYDLEQYCKNYFVNTKTWIPNDKKVVWILPSFQDPLIRDWIASCHPHLSTLLFPDFIKELWAEFLLQDWEDKVTGLIANS